MRLQGKSAIVTGAASGIGRDIAALFFAAVGSNALTDQSLIVSHGWFME